MIDLPVWVEVNIIALAGNTRKIRGVIGPKAEMMAVVKANAYGHGPVEVSKVVLANGATQLAVARTAEGVELRQAGINAPILVLGYTPAGLIREVVEYGFEQTVFDLEYARLVNEKAKEMGVRIPVHIKIDTGMGRIGVLAGSAKAIGEIREMASLSNLDAIGIFTHFAAADQSEKSYTMFQLESFNNILEQLRRQGLEFSVRHCANSAAAVDMPESCLDMVRAGIVLYGLYPSEEINRTELDLDPAMSFKTRVTQVKSVPSGFSVSYGCAYKTGKPTVIATLPVGYADGYARRISGKGSVLIRGKRAPVIGRICMDQCMVDVSDIPGVIPGDEVVLFGRQGGLRLPAEEVAGWIGTINYEVVCMVGARVPRVFTDEVIN